MTTLKRIASLLLVLAIVAVMATAAFAAEETYTLKITGTTTSPTDGHTYTVYQIFTGTLEETAGQNIMVDVKYGMNYTPGEAAIGSLVPIADLEAITDANAFAQELIDTDVLEGTYATLNAANNWTKENVPAGYYLILDTTENLPELHTRSAYIVQVVEDVDMAPKSGVTTVVKKVKDVNDSTGTTSDWQDSADHDVGDEFPYQIVSTFTGLGEFEDYKIVLNDTMSKGLTYMNNAAITMQYTVLKADGTTATATKTVTDKFELTTAASTETEGAYVGGTVLTMTCEDLKAIVAEEGNLINATITVDYTVTLNENAVIGAAGNPNKVHLIYDREPNGEGTGKTPDDVNIVFTFKSVVNKVDSEKKPLTGAEFKLEKFVASAEGTETYKEIKGSWKTLEYVKNDEGTVFTFNGLDDGYYRIVETVTPAGYNAIEPITFTVTADHDVLADDPQLTDLKADVVKADGTAYTEEEILSGSIAQIEVTKQTGELTTEVVNNAGTLLPETGGIGTYIFYILGGLLVVGAVVLLITRKRMSV